MIWFVQESPVIILSCFHYLWHRVAFAWLMHDMNIIWLEIYILNYHNVWSHLWRLDNQLRKNNMQYSNCVKIIAKPYTTRDRFTLIMPVISAAWLKYENLSRLQFKRSLLLPWTIRPPVGMIDFLNCYINQHSQPLISDRSDAFLCLVWSHCG